MPAHKMARFILRLWPRLSWRIPSFRRHMELCPECSQELCDIREGKRATIARGQLGAAKDFWPGIIAGLKKAKTRPEVGLRLDWRWALGLAGLMTAALVGVLVLTAPRQVDGRLNSAVKLRINYVQVYDEPAQALIFQTQDPNWTFVWVEKQN